MSEKKSGDTKPLARGIRERLPVKRYGNTYTLILKGKSGEQKAHVTLNYSKNERLLEFFIDVNQTGSDVMFYFHQWAITTSKLLQYGAPLHEAIGKLRGIKLHSGTIDCEPVEGIHGGHASSLMDAVVQLVLAETDDEGRRA